MKHSFTIDSQSEQRSQWKRLLETVAGRLPVVIAILMLLTGLSLAISDPSNVAHAAAKSPTQEKTAMTSSKDVGSQLNQEELSLQRGHDRDQDRHRDHGGHDRDQDRHRDHGGHDRDQDRHRDHGGHDRHH